MVPGKPELPKDLLEEKGNKHEGHHSHLESIYHVVVQQDDFVIKNRT
jgi:hypothetical protein